jgi:hypothetical protein
VVKHQDPPLVTDQPQNKRRQDDGVSCESSSKATSTAKRQRFQAERGLKPPEYYSTLLKELKEYEDESENSRVDSVNVDREDIEEQLCSKSSILVLGSPPTWRGHC